MFNEEENIDQTNSTTEEHNNETESVPNTEEVTDATEIEYEKSGKDGEHSPNIEKLQTEEVFQGSEDENLKRIKYVTFNMSKKPIVLKP